MAETSLITTIGGWTVIGVIVAYIAYQRTHSVQRPKQTRQEQDAQARRKQPKQKNKAQSQQDDTIASSVASFVDNKLVNRKNKKSTPQNSSSVDTTPSTSHAFADTADKDDADNKRFAEQLKKTQQGTNLKTAEKASSKVRTNKQGKANKVAADIESSQTSSNPEASADDVSSVASPELTPAEAADLNQKNDVSGVADMLEPAAPGPSTLRLLPSEKSQRTQQPKVAKPEPEVETKKQRQRRKKREEEKAQRAEDEKVRKAQMERQMKTARTLDGTAKSHISKFTAVPAPANPWNTANGDGKNGQEDNKSFEGTTLLDTFEPKTETKPAETGEPVTKPVQAAVEDLQELKPIEALKTLGNGVAKANGVNGAANGAANGSGNGEHSSSEQNDGEWEKVPEQILDEGWQDATSKKSKKNKKKATAETA